MTTSKRHVGWALATKQCRVGIAHQSSHHGQAALAHATRSRLIVHESRSVLSSTLPSALRLRLEERLRPEGSLVEGTSNHESLGTVRGADPTIRNPQSAIRNRALTVLELLISVSLSSVVMIATLTLVTTSAGNSQFDDLRGVQAEARNLSSFVQDWLQRAYSIKHVYNEDTAPNPATPPALGTESAEGVIWAFMGESPDGNYPYNQIEALAWKLDVTYSSTGATGFAILERYYNSTNTTQFPDDPPTGDSCGPAGWLDLTIEGMEKEVVSSNVVRWKVEPASEPDSCSPGNPFFIDVQVGLIDLSKIGNEMPSMYSFDVAGTTRGVQLMTGLQ